MKYLNVINYSVNDFIDEATNNIVTPSIRYINETGQLLSRETLDTDLADTVDTAFLLYLSNNSGMTVGDYFATMGTNENLQTSKARFTEFTFTSFLWKLQNICSQFESVTDAEKELAFMLSNKELYDYDVTYSVIDESGSTASMSYNEYTDAIFKYNFECDGTLSVNDLKMLFKVEKYFPEFITTYYFNKAKTILNEVDDAATAVSTIINSVLGLTTATDEDIALYDLNGKGYIDDSDMSAFISAYAFGTDRYQYAETKTTTDASGETVYYTQIIARTSTKTGTVTPSGTTTGTGTSSATTISSASGTTTGTTSATTYSTSSATTYYTSSATTISTTSATTTSGATISGTTSGTATRTGTSTNSGTTTRTETVPIYVTRTNTPIPALEPSNTITKTSATPLTTDPETGEPTSVTSNIETDETSETATSYSATTHYHYSATFNFKASQRHIVYKTNGQWPSNLTQKQKDECDAFCDLYHTKYGEYSDSTIDKPQSATICNGTKQVPKESMTSRLVYAAVCNLVKKDDGSWTVWGDTTSLQPIGQILETEVPSSACEIRLRSEETGDLYGE